MTNDQHTVEHVFCEALELPPDERQAYVNRACQDSPELRLKVEELLLEDERAGSFMAAPLFDQPEERVHPTLETQPLQLDRLRVERALVEPRFKPHQLIADRFSVTRFIARGGMGEVYEVEDRLLQGFHVALKIILPEVAADPRSSYRFQQEVLLARQVNHRNLCPIYDIFRCDGPESSFLFLTMKLLRGETLANRLRRERRLPREDAVQICTELIAAVGALHQAGIVHRDIKPNNVMLEYVAGAQCVTLMDFGLARLHDSETTILQAGLVAGTPGYIAPELFRGQRPSQASDLYALGVVLHQVLTGERPPDAKSGLGVVTTASLKTTPAAPAALVQTIRDLLAVDPELRCKAFDRIHTGAADAEGHRRFTRRSFAIGAGAAACALVGGLAWKPYILEDLLHPLPSKRFVALLNWPPPADDKVTPLLTSLIDAMARELARAEAFDRNFFVASPEHTSEMRTPAQLNQVREALGANLVLATSGRTTPGNVHVLLQVLEPGSFRTLRSKEVHVAEDAQFSLSERVIRAAAELLDLDHFHHDAQRTQAGTDNPEALHAFQSAEALLKQPNNSGLDSAIDNFKQAVELDPHFATAHARLAVAYIRFYFEHFDPSSMQLARANAETALSLDPNSVEGHVALGSYFLGTGAYDDALHEMGRALALDPSDTRTMLYQGQTYASMTRWAEADETYKRVLKARPNLWIVYNELGNSYLLQGKFRLGLEAYQAASISSPRSAKALANMGIAWLQLGNVTAAAEAIGKSLAIAASDEALQTRADILRVQKKFTESLQASLQATVLNPDESLNWAEAADSYALLPHHAKEERTAFERAAAAQKSQLEVNPIDGPGWMLLGLYQAKIDLAATTPAHLRKAESLGGVDIFSQLTKVRILELLGRRDEALATLAQCFKRGATPFQVEMVHDLDALRTDVRYPPLLIPGKDPSTKV